MDEIERRVVAHELALIEVAAQVERSHMLEAIKAIRARFVVGITEGKRLIRVAAIDKLEDAMPTLKRGWSTELMAHRSRSTLRHEMRR